MTDPVSLPKDEEEFIIEKTVEGYTPDEITYLLRKDYDSKLREQTVKKFLKQENVAEKIELEKSIQEKNAEVSRDELVRDLKEQKEILKERSQHLRESESDEISNDTVKNLLTAIKDLAEMIDVLESKDDAANNVVNVNTLQQNFDITNSVKYLDKEDKKSVAEQLESDEDIEDYMIIRKDEKDDEDGDEENEEESDEVDVSKAESENG